MNRHIIGLTLFLVIIKFTFLLHLTFFAPSSLFSLIQTDTATITTPLKNSCFSGSDVTSKNLVYAEYSRKKDTLNVVVQIRDDIALRTDEEVDVKLIFCECQNFRHLYYRDFHKSKPTFRNGNVEIKISTSNGLAIFDKPENLQIAAQIFKQGEDSKSDDTRSEAVPILTTYDD